MSNGKRIFTILSIVIILLGVALIGVGMLTGGNAHRILYNTDIADMTKFFPREQIEAVVNFLVPA